MTSFVRGHRPDLTAAQLAGLACAAIPIVARLLNVFGVYHLAHEQEVALGNAVQWGVIAAGLLFAADAAIRVGRSHADAKVHAAALAGAPRVHTEPSLPASANGAAGDDHSIVTDEEEFGPHGVPTTAEGA
jgi:hypothetical protein